MHAIAGQCSRLGVLMSGIVGIKDIAECAGVSRAAVSCVLNNRPIRIGEEKRALIKKKAREMGYVPHAAARRLSVKRTETIGVVFPFELSALSHPYVEEMVYHLSDRARHHNYDLLLDVVHSETPSEISLMPGRVDGLIAVLERTTPASVYLECEEHGINYVAIGGAFINPSPVWYVDVDVWTGTQEITAHLIRQGHRRIAFMAGIPSAEKQRGYSAALESAGLPADSGLVKECGLRAETIRPALDVLLAEPEPPTALVSTNDELAMRLISDLAARGLSVPKDMAVAGFDDISTASIYVPALTTMRVPVQEMAGKAVDMLVGRINGKLSDGKAARQMFQPELRIRASG